MKKIDLLKNRLIELQQELETINIRRDIIAQEINNIHKELNLSKKTLSTVEKVKLFSALFKGRTDVYPRRFETKQGKSGYAPVCANQWKSGLCNKNKIKCTECNNRKYEAFSEEIIYYHLKGHKAGEPNDKDFVAGIYPILLDDSLLLAMPISWKGTLTQYAGRLHRTYHNKKEVQIYDYVDQLPMLNRMYIKRKAGYKLIGYKFKETDYEKDLL